MHCRLGVSKLVIPVFFQVSRCLGHGIIIRLEIEFPDFAQQIVEALIERTVAGSNIVQNSQLTRTELYFPKSTDEKTAQLSRLFVSKVELSGFEPSLE